MNSEEYFNILKNPLVFKSLLITSLLAIITGLYSAAIHGAFYKKETYEMFGLANENLSCFVIQQKDASKPYRYVLIDKSDLSKLYYPTSVNLHILGNTTENTEYNISKAFK